MANSAPDAAMAGQLGRAPNNWYQSLVDPVREAYGEPSSIYHGYRQETPWEPPSTPPIMAKERLEAFESMALTLENKMDKFEQKLDELIREFNFPQIPSAMAPPHPPPLDPYVYQPSPPTWNQPWPQISPPEQQYQQQYIPPPPPDPYGYHEPLPSMWNQPQISPSVSQYQQPYIPPPPPDSYEYPSPEPYGYSPPFSVPYDHYYNPQQQYSIPLPSTPHHYLPSSEQWLSMTSQITPQSQISPSTHLQQQQWQYQSVILPPHSEQYVFDEMSVRKEAHGGPKSEVLVFDKMFEERQPPPKDEDPTTENPRNNVIEVDKAKITTSVGNELKDLKDAGEDAKDFVNVEHCGDDFLAARADSLQEIEEPYELVGATVLSPVNDYKKVVLTIIEEYFSNGDVELAASYLRELGSDEYHHYFVKKLVSMAMDRHDKEKEMTSVLLSAWYGDVLKTAQISKVFFLLIESTDDIAIDILAKFQLLVPSTISDEWLDSTFLKPSGVDGSSGEDKMKKRLWDENFFDPATRKWTTKNTGSATYKLGLISWVWDPGSTIHRKGCNYHMDFGEDLQMAWGLAADLEIQVAYRVWDPGSNLQVEC